MIRAHHMGTVASRFRSAGSGVELLSPLNEKTPKGEAAGWLTALLYLAPHTLGVVPDAAEPGRSLCPYSTEACRTACLFHAGRGRTPRVYDARMRRTRRYWEDRPGFMLRLYEDLVTLHDAAASNDMRLAIRLNGTSDILWEREIVIPVGKHILEGRTIFDLFSEVTFYDYSKIPLDYRSPPPNYRLTFSLADDNLGLAVEYLKAGHSIAAVVPNFLKERLIKQPWIILAGRRYHFVDGDHDDLRFLDAPGSIVLLSPKGRASVQQSPLVRPNLISDLLGAFE